MACRMHIENRKDVTCPDIGSFEYIESVTDCHVWSVWMMSSTSGWPVQPVLGARRLLQRGYLSYHVIGDVYLPVSKRILRWPMRGEIFLT